MYLAAVSLEKDRVSQREVNNALLLSSSVFLFLARESISLPGIESGSIRSGLRKGGWFPFAFFSCVFFYFFFKHVAVSCNIFSRISRASEEQVSSLTNVVPHTGKDTSTVVYLKSSGTILCLERNETAIRSKWQILVLASRSKHFSSSSSVSPVHFEFNPVLCRPYKFTIV